MYRYGSIPSHPPTCQGRCAWTCTFPWRDLHETQFACVVHASHAIPRSNHSGRPPRTPPPPPPKRRLPTRPSLGLLCLAYDSGSARQIQIWHGPGHVPRGSGERWMCPCQRLVDRRCKARGCPRPWDRLADGRLLCRCNVTLILLTLSAHPCDSSHVCGKSNVQMVLVPTLTVSGGNQFYCLIAHTYGVQGKPQRRPQPCQKTQPFRI